MSKISITYKVVADDRERAVIPYFAENCEIKRLDVADYQIYIANRLVALIERKTWSDLIASLLDGRKNNIHKLLTLSEINIPGLTSDKETKCDTIHKIRIYYIIEGQYETTAKIPKNNLIAHLDHLSWRDDVHILYTSSEKATAERILALAYNISTCGAHEPVNIIKEVKGNGDIKVSIATDPEHDILSSLPAVGRKSAAALLSSRLSLPSMLAAMLLDPQKLKFKVAAIILCAQSGRTIGKAKADKISDCLLSLLNGDEKISISILKCIPGISPKAAAYIYAHCDFGDLLRGYISVSEIATISKSAKSKIGPKCAKLIEKYICAKIEI